MLTQDEEMLCQVVGFIKSQNYQNSLLDFDKIRSPLGKSINHSPSALNSTNPDGLKRKVETLISEKEQLAL
jgi:hypothetical protein